MFQFNIKCFCINILLLSILILIVMFVHDEFIRPFVGDVLAVFWIYFVLKSFIKASNYELAHYVLLIAFSVEIAQFYELINILGLQDNQIARIVMGSTFDWFDLLAYGVGWAIIVMSEAYRISSDKMSYRVD